MSSFTHLDLAIDSLEYATIQLSDANRMARFCQWPESFSKDLDLLRRASANLRQKMLQEMTKEASQSKFEFEKALEKTA